MLTCEHCKDRLLDYVYDLLEGEDLLQAREHLHVCSECQTALKMVQAQQKLLDRAAKAISEVAEFSLPAVQPARLPETLPLTPIPAPQRRSSWRRGWVGWATAAAVLVAVGAAYWYHRHTVHNLQEALAQKRKAHNDVTEQFAALPVKYKSLHNTAIGELRSSAAPYLRVVGPTTLEPGAKGHLHIISHHAEGTVRQVKEEFARSNVRIKVVEAQASKVVRVMRPKVDDDGQALVELDASNAAPGSTLNVLVEADTLSQRTAIQESVQVLPPTYATRIDANKIAYQVKDVLFFRVLVLERFSLLPPTQPIPMHVELLDPQGQIVRSLLKSTGAGGILADELNIDENFSDGNYTLNVRPADPAKTSVQLASRHLEVVRELRLPDFQFDKDRYLPGDQLSGVYRGAQPLPPRVLIGKESVPLRVEPMVAPLAPIPGAGHSAAKVKEVKEKSPAILSSMLQRFSAPIPLDIPAGASQVPFTVPLQEGKKDREIRTHIPLGPTEFSIDFFPEGGDLIAGLPNRVFYRVRSKTGEPVTGQGQVMLLTSRNNITDRVVGFANRAKGQVTHSAGENEIIDSTYHLGMGYLDFIPNPKETYTVRITTPAKTENVQAPFAKLGIRPEGVIIQVAEFGEDRMPKAVGSQGDPIRLTLRQQGPARKLLVLAQCRGQVLDQRIVEVKREPVDVTLLPTHEAAGMIRVTAYETHEGTLRPVAERLVYRGATQRLDLSFTLSTQQLRPGPASAKTTARDEKGQPAPAWLLASVIDERFQSLPSSLSAHFFLLNEIRTGPDLDNAQLILHDSPASTQVLERFLGTHGWRRFFRSDPPVLAVQDGAASGAITKEALVPRTFPLVFSRENTPLDAMQKQYEEKLGQVLTPIHKNGFLETQELESKRGNAAQAVALAVARLHDFELQIQVWLRLGLGIGLALLLGTSLVLMAVGAYRILRGHKQATPAFGGAFACLATCLAIMFVGAWIGPPSVTAPPHGADHVQGQPAWKIAENLGVHFAQQMPVAPNGAEKPLTGEFRLPAPATDNRRLGQGTALHKNEESMAKVATLALRERSTQAFARRDLGESVFADRKPGNQNFANGSPAWQQRGGGKKRLAADPSAVLPNPPDAKGDKTKKEIGKAADAVEYFHSHMPNVQSDTLLWHPSLWLGDGNADVRFDFASGNATYRVLLLGHSPTGRFGFYERRLDVLGR
jgi:hypothetical protein